MKPHLPLAAVVVLATAGNATLRAAVAADLFADNCASCHGLDGKARTPAGRKLGAKDLSLSRLSDAEITKQIVNGTKNERGADRMPSFKEKLTSEQIAALAAYVKSFRQ